MKMTAKNRDGSGEVASREAARRELEEARRIAERTPQTIVYTGLGPYKIDKSQPSSGLRRAVPGHIPGAGAGGSPQQGRPRLRPHRGDG